MFHGRDANRGLLDNRLDQGLKRDEWQASYKENLVRQQLGQPIRTHYKTGLDATTGVASPYAPRIVDSKNVPIKPSWISANW